MITIKFSASSDLLAPPLFPPKLLNMFIKVFLVVLLACAAASMASVTNTTVINSDCASGCNSSMFVAVKASSRFAKTEAIARRDCKKQCAIPALEKRRLCNSVCPIRYSELFRPRPVCVLCGGNRKKGIADCLKSLDKIESSCGFQCDNNVAEKLFAIHENTHFFRVSGRGSVSQVFPGGGRCM